MAEVSIKGIAFRTPTYVLYDALIAFYVAACRWQKHSMKIQCVIAPYSRWLRQCCVNKSNCILKTRVLQVRWPFIPISQYQNFRNE